jgi:hypothetical protein
MLDVAIPPNTSVSRLEQYVLYIEHMYEHTVIGYSTVKQCFVYFFK